MILVDFSQIAIARLMMIRSVEGFIIEEQAANSILKSLRSFEDDYGNEYGRLVVCDEGGQNWRRQVFEYYKAPREKSKKESDVDWDEIYGVMNKVRSTIRDDKLYRFLKVKEAEADDCIAIMSIAMSQSEKVLIVSSDRDFKQLQRFQGVKQFNPIAREMIVEPAPLATLKEHIIRGDSSDGIPNFKSPHDVFMTPGVRQKSIFKAKIEKWIGMEPKEFCETEEELARYNMNRRLIDLTMIPRYVTERILDTFIEQDNMFTE